MDRGKKNSGWEVKLGVQKFEVTWDKKADRTGLLASSGLHLVIFLSGWSQTCLSGHLTITTTTLTTPGHGVLSNHVLIYKHQREHHATGFTKRFSLSTDMNNNPKLVGWTPNWDVFWGYLTSFESPIHPSQISEALIPLFPLLMAVSCIWGIL